jgi:hypothetical protein
MAKLAHLKELEDLKAWAIAGGAENQAPTNPYELLRLRVRGGVAIVYRTDRGKLTWNDLARKLQAAMSAGGKFPDEFRLVKPVRIRPDKNSVTHRTLIVRDGLGCFFCFEEVFEGMTIEHLVPRAHGGPNHISNKFRACRTCNCDAGHLSAPEKIRIREANLSKRVSAGAAA